MKRYAGRRINTRTVLASNPLKTGGDGDALGGTLHGPSEPEGSPMRRLIIAAIIAAAVPVASASAQVVKQEVRELRDAKREVNHDQRDRRQAARAGDSAAVKHETREIREGKRDVKQERRDVKRAVGKKRND